VESVNKKAFTGGITLQQVKKTSAADQRADCHIRPFYKRYPDRAARRPKPALVQHLYNTRTTLVKHL